MVTSLQSVHVPFRLAGYIYIYVYTYLLSSDTSDTCCLRIPVVFGYLLSSDTCCLRIPVVFGYLLSSDTMHFTLDVYIGECVCFCACKVGFVFVIHDSFIERTTACILLYRVCEGSEV
jgi:hypothetical protein